MNKQIYGEGAQVKVVTMNLVMNLAIFGIAIAVGGIWILGERLGGL